MGRFWTERELGALLHKPTVIPVLHGVTFEEVSRYSAFLGDFYGFTTERDTITEITEKIVRSIVVEDPA